MSKAAAVSKLLIHDAFGDPGGTALTAHTIAPTNVPGTSWTVPDGAWSIQSGRPTATAVGTGYAKAICNPGVNNASGSFISRGVDSRNPGAVLRYVDTTNYWLVLPFSVDGNIKLYEQNASVYTLRASAAVPGGLAVGTDYTVTWSANGTDITAAIGATSISYSSASFQAATIFGFAVNSLNEKVDDYILSAL